MQLDTPTLFACIVVAELAGSAILLLFCLFWPSKGPNGARSLALWSAGLLLAGCGSGLLGMRGTIPDLLSVIASNFLIILGVGLRRAGFAAFLGQRGHIWVYTVVALGWMALCVFPGFGDNFLLRVNYATGVLILSDLWLVSMAFGQNRERLHSVRFLGITTAIECGAFVWYVLNQNLRGIGSMLEAFSSGFMTVYLVVLLFSIVMATVLPAAMVIELAFHRFLDKASRDPVTGLVKLRVFQKTVKGDLARTTSRSAVSVMHFQLDGLDTVRGRYNAAMSEALLKLFARVLKDSLPEDARAGHIAPERFAVYLPATDPEFAELTAQRLRRRFSLGCHEASGGQLAVPIRAGLVCAAATTRFEAMMEAAEGALEETGSTNRGHVVMTDLTGTADPVREAAEVVPARRKAA